MTETRDQLLALLKEEFGDAAHDLAAKNEQVFYDHQIVVDVKDAAWLAGRLDSLDRTEFLMLIEDRFHIEIPDTIGTGFQTIDDVAKYVDTMTSGALHDAQ